jgi:predicted O-methyltransferase YrrM
MRTIIRILLEDDYRTFYSQMKDAPPAVSRETDNLLYMLARSIGARSIVEFGNSFVGSTLHPAAALRDNGGGKLIGAEFEASKIEKAKRNLADGGLTNLVEIRSGDALKTLARDLPETIDLVLLDGAAWIGLCKHRRFTLHLLENRCYVDRPT